MIQIGNVPISARLMLVPGDDLALTLRLLELSARTPLDLTGWTAELVVLDGDGVEVYRLDSEIAMDASGGLSVTIPRADSADWTGGHVWRLRIGSPSDQWTTLMRGKVTPQ